MTLSSCFFCALAAISMVDVARASECNGTWAISASRQGREGASDEYWIVLRNEAATTRLVSLQGLNYEREVASNRAGGTVWTLVATHDTDKVRALRLVSPGKAIGFVAMLAAGGSQRTAALSFLLSFQELDPSTGRACSSPQMLRTEATSDQRVSSRNRTPAAEVKWRVPLEHQRHVGVLNVENITSMTRTICIRSIMGRSANESTALWSTGATCQNGPDAEVVAGGEATSRVLTQTQLDGLTEIIVNVEESASDPQQPHEEIALSTMLRARGARVQSGAADGTP
jgi:hypothetical protein